MSELDFLNRPKILAEFRPRARSPVERALQDADPALGIEDISLSTGKLEVRGELDELDVEAELVRITPKRALVLCPVEDSDALRSRLADRGLFVVDRWGALAGLRVTREHVMRRLTDLDLDGLPATGAVAHVRALVLRDGEGFRIFFPQEYGHYLAEVVVDAAKGTAP